MASTISHVRNPLTVIAIFAGLAEVSGTAVLPALKESTQGTYVWFLMSFPTLLVVLFFFILFFRHHVLYAPSDYRDENLFANLFVRGSSKQRLEKLVAESAIGIEDAAGKTEADNAEANPQGREPASAPAAETQAPALPPKRRSKAREEMPVEPSDKPSTRSEFLAKAALAEELVIARIGNELGISLDRDISRSGRADLMVDAISLDAERPVLIEAKLITPKTDVRTSVRSALSVVDRFSASLPLAIQGRLTKIIALVADGFDDEGVQQVKWSANQIATNAPSNIQVRVYRFVDLENSLSSGASLETRSQWWQRTFGPSDR